MKSIGLVPGSSFLARMVNLAIPGWNVRGNNIATWSREALMLLGRKHWFWSSRRSDDGLWEIACCRFRLWFCHHCLSFCHFYHQSLENFLVSSCFFQHFWTKFLCKMCTSLPEAPFSDWTCWVHFWCDANARLAQPRCRVCASQHGVRGTWKVWELMWWPFKQ